MAARQPWPRMPTAHADRAPSHRRCAPSTRSPWQIRLLMTFSRGTARSTCEWRPPAACVERLQAGQRLACSSAPTARARRPQQPLVRAAVRRSGAIGPKEFADRFFGIFGGCPGAADLFVQMALMVPAPERRLALLRLAEDVSGGSGGGGRLRLSSRGRCLWAVVQHALNITISHIRIPPFALHSRGCCRLRHWTSLSRPPRHLWRPSPARTRHQRPPTSSQWRVTAQRQQRRQRGGGGWRTLKGRSGRRTRGSMRTGAMRIARWAARRAGAGALRDPH